MSHLSLKSANPEYERDNYRCGNGRMNHARFTKDQIMKNVTNYQPPPSCSYLLEVEVGDKTFEGVRNAANGRLRFVEVVSNLKNV